MSITTVMHTGDKVAAVRLENGKIVEFNLPEDQMILPANPLDQMHKHVEKLLENELDLPPIPVQVRDHIAAYKEANLIAHEGEMYFAARCEQAKAAGFRQITGEDAVRMLTHDATTRVYECQQGRASIEWFYDHLYQKIATTTSFSPLCYYPPFFSRAKWKIYMVPLGSLRCVIPYGILLRIAELKKLNFFNCFFAFAPESEVNGSFTVEPKADPIVVATLCNKQVINTYQENRQTKYDVNLYNANFAHFFVGKW